MKPERNRKVYPIHREKQQATEISFEKRQDVNLADTDLN